MSESIQQKWQGEVLVFRLRDADGSGFLGMERETVCELAETELRCKGIRMGGLNVRVGLDQITDVTPRLYPFLTLDVTTPHGRVEIPAAAHDFTDLMILSEKIEEAARRYQSAMRASHSGAAAIELQKLGKLVGDSSRED